MKKILLFGAGKSATALIQYLIRESHSHEWQMTIVDQDAASIREKTAGNNSVRIRSFNIQQDQEARRQLIADATVVISLLPAPLHILVARDCIFHKKHLLTASYLSPEVQQLAEDIQKAGILFMGEMGLDPGIDHMSAMKTIHKIKTDGDTITAFESFCGALIAPESDDNPWHYKITWSPRSMLTAGKDGATFRKNGQLQTIPYDKLFGSCLPVTIPGLGELAYYPNRDSMRYARLYALNEVPTILRATLRHPDFCTGWQCIVNLGLTDTEVPFQTQGLSYKNWLSQQIRQSGKDSGASEIFVKESLLHSQFAFLGLMENRPIDHGMQSSGEILFPLLSQKLTMQPEDRDMVVMLHRLSFKHKGQKKTHQSVLTIKGTNNADTAIAKTVGLPIGILTKLLLTNQITLTGLHIPILPEIYIPVLKELEQEGIRFKEFEDYI